METQHTSLQSKIGHKLYFAHPVSDYGKARELKCLKFLESNFTIVILNPNQKEHNDSYLKEGMSYFEKLVVSCESLVAIPFEDGEWGFGVWREAEAVAKNGGTIFEFIPETEKFREVDYKDIRPLSINETRRRVKSS
jgi:hypothetical protein